MLTICYTLTCEEREEWKMTKVVGQGFIGLVLVQKYIVASKSLSTSCYMLQCRIPAWMLSSIIILILFPATKSLEEETFLIEPSTPPKNGKGKKNRLCMLKTRNLCCDMIQNRIASKKLFNKT